MAYTYNDDRDRDRSSNPWEDREDPLVKKVKKAQDKAQQQKLEAEQKANKPKPKKKGSSFDKASAVAGATAMGKSKGTSPGAKIGDGMVAAGAASGNPYLLAAGLAMSTIASGREADRQARKDKVAGIKDLSATLAGLA